jgi:hypothetical protein
MLKINNELIQFDPLEEHEHEIENETLKKLSSIAVHKMVTFRHSDLIDQNGERSMKQKLNQVKSQYKNVRMHNDSSSTSSHSRSLKSFNNLQWWGGDSCYPGDDNLHMISVGISVDYGFAARVGGSTLDPLFLWRIQQTIASNERKEKKKNIYFISFSSCCYLI